MKHHKVHSVHALLAAEGQSLSETTFKETEFDVHDSKRHFGLSKEGLNIFQEVQNIPVL